ncbi:hypothetical protein B0A55_03647 [Friedmanniomyces simplex]|uniref:Serine aminopeptidase S33 domain-containing protein n=1 Tax=Friedmanniomyces simplex TaxID=329884 RepID=A0A4U0XK42_9PEZI|nr:hypothetical protein B0A55_03647 [Friedmanniomyces simplex]
MANVSTVEGWLTTPDSRKLYTKTWQAITDPPKARLAVVHGFSDHCNTYGILFPTLAQQGISVYSFDQRGWGRSVHEPAQKGRTGPTRLVMEDITTFIRSLPKEENEHAPPLFLLGHSMGGAEVLHYAATGPQDVLSSIRGFLCESPFIALHPSGRPLAITVILGRLAGKVLPNRHMVSKLDATKLSRDPEVCKEYEDDPLCHDTGTLEGLASMLDRAHELQTGKVELREGVGEGGQTRLWVGHGTSDQICEYQACRDWYDTVSVKDKEMRVYEGWYHKLHAEPGDDNVRFADDVAKWILDRADPVPEEQAAAEAKSKL